MGDSTPTPPRCPRAARRRPRCSISAGEVRKLTPDKDETARGIALRIGRADRLTSLTPPGESAITYTWDDNGNLTDRGSDESEWDFEDRMVSATVDSAETTFAYRGDGLRESRTVNSNTVTFTWEIAAGLPVVIDDEDARYVYGAGLASQVTSGESYYYLSDGLGSTMVTVDSDGRYTAETGAVSA